jgi:hypothetical protein
MRSFLALTALSLLLHTGISGQDPVTIVFSGTFTDIGETIVPAAACDITFSMIQQEKILLEQTATVTTDDSGNAAFFVTGIPEVFNDEELQTVDVIITLRAKEGSEWMLEDEFMVKYHLEKAGPDGYRMIRFEGQRLDYAFSDPVWYFTDVYPFGYLKSKFIVSFSDRISDPESVIAIFNEQIVPSLEAVPPAPVERGLKGGYAVGGFKKE